MRYYALLIVAFALPLTACGEKKPGVLQPPKTNNDSGCRASDCTGGTRCDDETGECVPRATNNTVTNNGTTPNNTTTATNNTIGPTNNGTNNTVGPVPCEDLGDPARFVDWPGNGIDVAISRYQDEPASYIVTSGVAMVDFDGDGDLDVMITNNGGALAYFTNDGAGAFTDATTAAGVAGLTQTSSLSAADFDGDGDTDVVVGRLSGAYVLENQGDGTFVNASAVWGIGQATDVVSGGAFGDFDGDGDLDFYLASYTMEAGNYPTTLPNRLYRNDGTTFRELTTSPGGPGSEGGTLGIAWWDFDGDGRQDLWVANDFGMTARPNQLWRNMGRDPLDADNWLFEEVASAANLDIAVFSMSATLGDFDNDGDRDAYVANAANNVLHVVNGTTTTNEAVARGVASGTILDPMPRPVIPPIYMALIPEMQAFIDDYTDPNSGLYTLSSWSSMFFDADQDGWQDLWVSNGQIPSFLTPEASFQPNFLFVNNAGTFRQSECWETPSIRASTRGAAVGDLDGDGDVDVIWVDNGINGAPVAHVARNEMASGNWLTVQLRGASPNTDAIGAKVTLVAGGITQTRWIDGGQSFMSVSERVAHFGLGAATSVDSLVVTWPDGSVESRIVDAINQRLLVEN